MTLTIGNKSCNFFDTLPEELLLEGFKWIDKPDTLDALLLVSRRCRAAVKHLISKNLLTSPDCVLKKMPLDRVVRYQPHQLVAALNIPSNLNRRALFSAAIVAEQTRDISSFSVLIITFQNISTNCKRQSLNKGLVMDLTFIPSCSFL